MLWPLIKGSASRWAQSHKCARLVRRASSSAQAGRTAAGGSGSDPGQGADESVTGMFHHILGQNPELKDIVETLEKYIPFIAILLVKLFFDHSAGIVTFICLLTTFTHANSVVKQQVAQQGRKNKLALLAVLVNLVACIGFIYYMFQDEKLYNCAIFLPPSKIESFYDLFWFVGVNDFILKFVSVIFKVGLLLLPNTAVPYQKRGKYFLFIERTSQIHRELAPIHIWLLFLLNGYERIPGKVLGVIMVAVYMVAKGKLLLKSARCWKQAIHKILQSKSYGKNPNPDEIKASGGSCPICYEDYRLPTLLHCKHIFCEECLATWFDREKTCPLCRAQVTEDPEWRDGSTSHFVQLF
ncbi:RING finger and transmembrane domain-containing protein 2-like [Tigriopus californicus]|nr:RING finger and transmembrane domain-containing protein 2-like [Tigriopus californicus]